MMLNKRKEGQKTMNKKLCMVLLALMLMLMSCVALGANKDLSVYEGLDENVKNILLIGTNATKASDGRTELVMIFSANKETGKANIISLACDTWVEIGDKGTKNKLNMAYSLGGADLLMQTVNRMYNLNIESYVRLNFEGLQNIVDAMGGVSVQLEKDEAWMIKEEIKDSYDNLQAKALPANAKEATLNGVQALAYMRSMKLGNDFDRQDRQQKVLRAMGRKVRSCSATELVSLVTKVFGCVTTNLTLADSIDLATKVASMDISSIGMYRFPGEGEYSYDSKNGVSKLIVDTAYGTQKIHSILYPAAE